MSFYKHDAGALRDMEDQRKELADAVEGHRITGVEKTTGLGGITLTLDTGRVVTLRTTSDCCAYSEIEAFVFRADKIDHIITKVVCEDDYEKWHILAGMHEVLGIDLAWGEGNYPYYSFGFDIEVEGA